MGLKIQGKFDAGWDAYRGKVFSNQKKLGLGGKRIEVRRRDRTAIAAEMAEACGADM
jgi:hypothetical protein